MRSILVIFFLWASVMTLMGCASTPSAEPARYCRCCCCCCCSRGAQTASDEKPTVATEATEINEAGMRALGARAASGDLAAMDDLAAAKEKIYAHRPGERPPYTNANLDLMRAATDVIGQAAGSGNGKAMAALLYGTENQTLRNSMVNPIGIAAGMGNREALEVLLHYEEYDFLLSSVVFALQPAARQQYPEAVDFLIDVVENDRYRPLWLGATDGLKVAAESGHVRARQAIEKYEAFREENRKAKSQPAG